MLNETELFQAKIEIGIFAATCKTVLLTKKTTGARLAEELRKQIDVNTNEREAYVLNAVANQIENG